MSSEFFAVVHLSTKLLKQEQNVYTCRSEIRYIRNSAISDDNYINEQERRRTYNYTVEIIAGGRFFFFFMLLK